MARLSLESASWTPIIMLIQYQNLDGNCDKNNNAVRVITNRTGNVANAMKNDRQELESTHLDDDVVVASKCTPGRVKVDGQLQSSLIRPVKKFNLLSSPFSSLHQQSFYLRSDLMKQ